MVTAALVLLAVTMCPSMVSRTVLLAGWRAAGTAWAD